MENKRPTFDETVSVLVKAYMNDTLRHGDCYACAVGNIIAASIGCEFVGARRHLINKVDFEWAKNGAYYEPVWQYVFYTDSGGFQVVFPKKYRGTYKKQVDITGYSWQELAKIENSFEAPYDPFVSRDENIFNGLMAVLETLAEIHGVDLTTKEEAEKLFVKA